MMVPYGVFSNNGNSCFGVWAPIGRIVKNVSETQCSQDKQLNTSNKFFHFQTHSPKPKLQARTRKQEQQSEQH